jgi:hypothetical protein
VRYDSHVSGQDPKKAKSGSQVLSCLAGISVALDESEHFLLLLLDADQGDNTGFASNGTEPESLHKDPGESGFRKAELWSTLTFDWLSPLLVFGRQRPVEVDNIPKLFWKVREVIFYNK